MWENWITKRSQNCHQFGEMLIEEEVTRIVRKTDSK